MDALLVTLLEPSPPSTVLPPTTTKVNFSNIEAPFKKDDFTEFLSLCIRKKCTDVGSENSAFYLQDYCAEEKSVVVEFQSQKVALSVCTNVQFVPYKLDALLVTLLEPSPPSTVLPPTTTKVNFSNIEAPFKKDDFTEFLSLCIRKKCTDVGSENSAFYLQDYCAEEKSVVVEFQSQKVALSVCTNVQFVPYKLDALLVTLLEPSPPPTVLPPTTTKVNFSNIEAPFKKDDFTEFLSLCIRKKCTDVGSENSAFYLQDYCAEEKSVVVEFQSQKVALSVCTNVQFVPYRLDELRLTLCEPTLTFSDFAASVNEPSTVFSSDVEVPITNLDGDMATRAFLEECIALGTVKPFRGTHDNMDAVCRALKQKHNICVDVGICTLKKKRLDENYRRNPAGKYFKYMRFLRGESCDPPTLSAGNKLCSNDGEVLALAKAKFTKGSVMPEETVFTLIDVWNDMKEEYLKVHKDSHLFRKISAEMALRGKFCSPDQCHNKVRELVAEFKEYSLALRRTGQGRPRPWKFYEALRPILEGSVTTQAEQTYAVGAAIASRSNSLLLPTADSNQERYGKERPAAKPDERSDLLKSLIESRKEILVELKAIGSTFRGGSSKQ